MTTEELKQLVERRNTLRVQRVNILRKRQELQHQRVELLKRRECVEASYTSRERETKLKRIQAQVEKLQLEIRWLQESSERCQLVAAEFTSTETSLQGKTDSLGVSPSAEMILIMQEKLQKLQEDVQRQLEEGKCMSEYIVQHKAR